MRLVKWYYNQPSAIKALFNSIISAIGFFVTAIVPNELVNSLQILELYQKALVYLGVFVLVFSGYFLIIASFKRKKEIIDEEKRKEEELYLLAYTECDKIVTEEMIMFSDNRKIEDIIVGDSLDSLNRLVKAAYETFDAYFGLGNNPSERIKFEVTFMSKSYIDNEITIPAFQNKENRKPTSLQIRKNDKKCYDNTITASIYRETRPMLRIIEDTNDPRTGYVSLYPDQKERIRSMIVFPVLSNENILLGTLVIHCDRKGFFKLDKTSFWRELLEVFAKRLAYEKLYLDQLVHHAAVHSIDISNIKDIF